MEEYGTGRYSRKHSTFYKTMMEELGLHTSKGGGGGRWARPPCGRVHAH